MIKNLFCSLVLILSINAFAGEGHNHNHEAALETPLNGGILRDAPPYKAELVINDDQAKIYLYKKHGEELRYANVKANELKGNFSHMKLPKAVQKKGGIEVTFVKGKEKKSVKENNKYIQKEVEFFTANLEGSSKVHRFDMHVNFADDDGKNIVLDFGIDNIH